MRTHQPNPVKFKHNNRPIFKTIDKSIVGQPKKLAHHTIRVPSSIIESKDGKTKYEVTESGAIVKL
jgi:hypothetical protein